MLKQLKLRKMIELKKKEQEEFRTKEAELMKREAELEQSLEESENEEDLNLVNEEIDKLEKEKVENDESKSKVEKEIEDLEKELKETEEKEEKQEEDDRQEEKEERNQNNSKFERRTNKMGEEKRKSRYVDYLTRQERREYVRREDVSRFISNVKQAVQSRSIENLDMTIPEVMMELIRDNIGNYSTFYNLVNLRPVGGTARANIIDEAVEGIWTEMVGKINELNYGLSQIEVDGYKVGGFTGADNSIIEDSDEDVSLLIEDLLSESIAIALDKAIAYGKGKDNKMPKGYVTALNNSADLKSKNIINLTAAKTTLAEIIKSFGNINRGTSNRGSVTVVMNEATWLKTIIPLSLATNSSGAYASALQGVFPGTGYKVAFCNQIPENDIHAGDYTKYLLAERKGKKVTSSTEAKFIEDITLFKATARYDGIPTREGAFVVIGLNGTTATTEVTFAPDTANQAEATAQETNE